MRQVGAGHQPSALLVHSQGAGVSSEFHDDFTFTISCAKIPPTTAHTGAISQKQYLEDRQVKHSIRALGAVLDQSPSQRAVLELASRREN